MNQTHNVHTLHRTDAVTAGRIMADYAVECSTEALFQKTYQRYLVQTAAPAACMETMAVMQDSHPPRRTWRYSGYAIAAAACLGICLLALGMQERSPIHPLPDDSVVEVPPHESAAETTTETMTETTETTSAQTTCTSPLPVIVTETTVFTEIVPEETEETSTPAATQAPPSPETTPLETEGTSPLATAVATTTETTTTEMTTTTQPPVSLGTFNVSESSGSFFQLTYVRANPDPVTEQEHSFAAEGFTLTNTMVQNPDYDFRSVIYNLEDTAGQNYMIQQFRYDYFMPTFSTEYYPLTKSYTIGETSVFLVYREDPETVCHLMWDDGCHICEMTSQYKDLAQMERLVQGQTAH